MHVRHLFTALICLLFWLPATTAAWAQSDTIPVTILVHDVESGEPLSLVTLIRQSQGLLLHRQSSDTLTTDAHGLIRAPFVVLRDPSLGNRSIPSTITLRHPGYLELSHTFFPSQYRTDTLRIGMEALGTPINPLEVVADRKTYSPDGNPAVALVDAILAQRSKRQQQRPAHTFRTYDKLTLSLSNFDLNNRLLNRAFPFFHRYVGTSRLDNKWTLPLSIRETVTDLGYNPTTRKKNEIIRYRNVIGLDRNIDDGTISLDLEEIFPHIDIYTPEIKLLNNRFVSPISPLGKHAYRYYLTDTLIHAGRVCRRVDFYPLNPRTLCFRGYLLATTDDAPSVVMCDLQVPKEINLNFISGLRITQEYREVHPDVWAVVAEDMYLSMALYHRLLSLYAEHSRRHVGFDFEDPDREPIHAEALVSDLSHLAEAKRYGAEMEQSRLLASSEGLKTFVRELKDIPKYKLLLDIGEMLATGYIRTDYHPNKVFGGSKVDIGNIYTFFGRNEIEGARIRLGGRTTGYLHPNLFLEGYGAYGIRDQKWKYSVTGTISLVPKRYFRDEYPKRDLSLRIEQDLYTPGQIYNEDSKDNVLYNIGTSYLTNRSYRESYELCYRHDWISGVSTNVFVRKTKDTPTGQLSYIRFSQDYTYEHLDNIRLSLIGAELRYAPGERIYEGVLTKAQKRRLQRDVPIFTLRHETALKLLGGDYTYNRTEIGIEHRLWLKTFGNFDYKVLMGKIWNSVPFPMLYTPPANKASSLNEFAFQLMEPMEYIADEYLSLFASYHLRGLIFNRLPLIKKLNLRGVLSFNALYGNTTELNSASTSKEIFLLPKISSELHRQFYAEVGFGIENILRILRIDLYHRLTERGPHSPPEWGVKWQLSLDF